MIQAWKKLRRASLAASALNLLASVLLALFLNRALDPEQSVGRKLQELATPSPTWAGSWLVWMLAALSLILFFVHWGDWLDRFTHGEDRAWILFGVLLGCLGMIPDTLAETLYLGTLPRLAKQALEAGPGEAKAAIQSFSDWEFSARLLTGFLGNGFYALGGLVLQCLALKTKALPAFCRYFGFIVWGSAVALSAAVLAANTPILYASTAVTMASFVLWSAWLGGSTQPEPKA
jgi:hypothetical protein